MTYLDTSAATKLFLVEAESAAFRAFLSGHVGVIDSSEYLITELLRAVESGHGSVPAARTFLGQLDLLPVSTSVLERAGRLPSPPQGFLRAGDAIHIVSAMELGELSFLTYDRRQAQAAAHYGFDVVAPGRPDGWYV